MFTIKHELETLFIIIIASAITLFVFSNSYKLRLQHIVTPILPASSSPSINFKPISVSASQDVSVDSLDGSETITLKTIENNNLETYSFYTSNKNNEVKKIIFSKAVGSTEKLLLPDNAWDPNGRYFFITDQTASTNNYYVIPSFGSLSDNSQSVNVSDLFFKKYPNYGSIEATGWGGYDLLIINAKNTDGSKGPSFWFEVPSQSFIQLATRFD